MTTIAVIGPGAVGGTVAAWLAQGGHEVTLCVRTPFEGLKVETPVGPIFASPRVLADPRGARPVDWVLVCVKAYDAAAAQPWLAALSVLTLAGALAWRVRAVRAGCPEPGTA